MKIKSKIKICIYKVISNDFLWRYLYKVYLLFSIIYNYRLKIENESKESLKKKFKKPIVKDGPFAGMIYPGFQTGENHQLIFPKLFGNYESEIFPILDIIFKKNYTEVLDIGCAEGYYAVGFAMKFPDAKIYAFDIDSTALRLCEEMAKLNNVSNRIYFNSNCTSNNLKDFCFNKALIFCDVEGYEKELFKAEVVPHLKNVDLLIETHNFIEPNISDYLKNIFNSTHIIYEISSEPDSKRLKELVKNDPALQSLPVKEQIMATYIKRPKKQTWLFLTPKN